MGKKIPKHEEAKLGSNLAISADNYDFEKIQAIVKALDFLRHEAATTQNKKITSLITSCFNMCFICHDLAMASLTKKPKNNHVI